MTLDQNTQTTIELMLRAGAEPVGISKTLDVPLYQVQEVAQFTQSVTYSTALNPKDAELADAMRELAWVAYNDAMLTMKAGNPTDRASLTRAIIGRSMALVGAEKTSKFETLRAEFDQMVGSIRSPEPEYEYDLPEDNEDAVTAGSTSSDPYDY